MKHHHSQAHFNLAGEYNRGRAEGASPDKTLAPAPITLDEYVRMVQAFGRCVMTYTKPSRREYDELDEILMRIDPQ